MLIVSVRLHTFDYKSCVWMHVQYVCSSSVASMSTIFAKLAVSFILKNKQTHIHIFILWIAMHFIVYLRELHICVCLTIYVCVFIIFIWIENCSHSFSLHLFCFLCLETDNIKKELSRAENEREKVMWNLKKIFYT